MSWARVDDGWWCHPKVLGVSLTARGLWVSALSWSCAQRRDEVPRPLLAMLGATAAEAVELVDAGLWVEVDDGYRIHDWAEYQDLTTSERRAIAGRRGGQRSGEARAKQTEASPSKHPLPPAETSKQTASKPKQAEAKAEAGPVPSRPVPSRPTQVTTSLALVAVPDSAPVVPESTYPADFSEWWSTYPRKVGKAAAAKAYRKARKRHTAGELLAAIESHRDAWRANYTDEQFIPHPSTWLNEGRYDDPPPKITGPARRPTKADDNMTRLRASAERMGVIQ